MQEVDLNFHPVDVSKSLVVSESITTELCNLEFEEKTHELTQAVNRGGCTANVEQPSAPPSDHTSDVAGSSNTSISPGDGNKHIDIDTSENINRKVRSKEQTEPDVDDCKETTNSHSHKEDCEQEASSCSAYDQVQSYEQIVSSYGQVQSYQQTHSAYDVIQDYSQVPYYEHTSNPYDQTQDYETVCAYENFHGRPVDSDAV